jgi:hypothetical protein
MVRDPAVPVENQPAIEQTITEKLNTIWTDFSYHYQWLDEIPSDPNGKLRILVSKVQ